MGPAECWVPGTMPTPTMQMAAATTFQPTESSLMMQPDALPPPQHLEFAKYRDGPNSQIHVSGPPHGSHVLSLVQALEESSYVNADEGFQNVDPCDSGEKK